MPIVNTVSLSEFRDAFQAMDRGNNFSYAGLEALYEYIDSYYDDINENYELDVIALCCDYTEVEGADDFLKNYGTDLAVKWKDIKRDLAESNWDGGEGGNEDFPEDDEERWDFDQDEAEEKFRDEVVGYHTTVIPIGNGPGFIYAAF